MKWNRREAVLALTVAAFLSYVVYRGANRGSDFKYPYGAARLLRTTGSLHVEAQPRYPVSLHVMLVPLSALPLGWAVAFWAGLSALAVASLPGVLGALSGVEPRRQLAAWALAGPFFADALILGQSDPLNLALVSAGVLAASRGRGLTGAGLVGLAGLIKILPFLQWVTLLARRRSWDVAAGMALSLGLGFGMVATAVGWTSALEGIKAQVAWVRDAEKPWHLVARGTDLRPNNESLPIVLARTFGDLPPGRLDPNAVSLARLPLAVVWGGWGAILGVLSLGWLAALRPAGRVTPGRGWLGVFALTSILMLASAPICWHHYFLWTLPAALFLIHRRRLVISAAVVSMLVSTSQTARGLGGHMVLALGLFALVVYDLSREASASGFGARQAPAVRPDPGLYETKPNSA